MIEYIRGAVSELNATYVVIETHGIGHLCNITIPTYESLLGKTEAKLLIHEVIREDAHILYGFITRDEREVFRLLLSVNGVGANTARMILSGLNLSELSRSITSGDHKRLTAIKGIGSKTAQRIVVELKDKINPDNITLNNIPDSAPASNDIRQEALAALVMLGFPRPQSKKVLDDLFDIDPTLRVEKAIKLALTRL